MNIRGIAGPLLAVVFFGFPLLFGTVIALDYNIAVQQGEPTEGTVVGTEIDVREDDDGPTEYRARVTYEYDVNGETYTSENVFAGFGAAYYQNRTKAEAVLDDYSEGQQVTAFYHSHNPERAYLREADGRAGAFFGTVGAAGLVLFSLWYIKTGLSRRRERTLVEDAPSEPVNALSVGPSEVTGRATAGEREPIEAPFSDDTCVYADYSVREYNPNTQDHENLWSLLRADTESIPFYVDDGTGQVLVRPDEEAFEFSEDSLEEMYVESDERGPDPVAAFVENTDGLDFPADASGRENDREYRQRLIREGDEVYVFGTVQRRDNETADDTTAQEDSLVVERVEDDSLREPLFLVSDNPATDVAKRRSFGAWRLPVGGVLLVAVFVALVLMYGPMVGVPVPLLW